MSADQVAHLRCSNCDRSGDVQNRSCTVGSAVTGSQMTAKIQPLQDAGYSISSLQITKLRISLRGNH